MLFIVTLLQKPLWDFSPTKSLRMDTQENFLNLIFGQNCT